MNPISFFSSLSFHNNPNNILAHLYFTLKLLLLLLLLLLWVESLESEKIKLKIINKPINFLRVNKYRAKNLVNHQKKKKEI